MLPADRGLVERDPAIPGLATVLDPAASAQLIDRLWPDLGVTGARTPYVRYKAGASCLSGVEVSAAGGIERFSCKALSLGASDKWSKACDDGRARVDASRRVVVRRFPADGDLRGPHWLLDPARGETGLEALGLRGAAIDVLAWKPERRFVARASVDGRPVSVIKCHEGAAYERALAAHAALSLVPGLPVVPATTWHQRRRVIVTPWVEGTVLQVATDPLHAFSQVGFELAGLHEAPLVLPAGPGASAEQQSLERLTRDVAWCLPDLGPALTRLVARLAGLREEEAAPAVAIHGDFHARQVLMGESGVTFLDFDEAAMGDPHADLALFLAHVERDAVRHTCTRTRAHAVKCALLEGYGQRRDVDREHLRWRTAEALLRLAPHPFRHRQEDWPAITRALVSRCEALLDGAHRSARPRAGGGEASVTRRLQQDAALAFCLPLLRPEVASRALGLHRDGAASVGVTVSAITCLRHKPGRRCLLAFSLADEGGRGPSRWIGKVRAKGTDHRAATIHRALWQAGVRHIAEPLGTVESFHLTLQREVPGTPLVAALGAGAAPAWAGERIAMALHALHRTAVAPGRAWTVDDELAVLRGRLGALRERQPALAAQVGRVQGRLVDLAGPLRHRAARAVLHRDFYHDQVLLDDGHCTVVDLDLVATGDPALDVGNFLAHAVDLAWRQDAAGPALLQVARHLATTAGRLAPASMSPDAVARYALLALGRLVEIAAHHHDRRQHVPRLLARLEEHLPRSGRGLDLSAFPEDHLCDVA